MSGEGALDADELAAKPGAWVDLALTLPIFIGYHLGVVFLHVRNASDLVTGELLRLTEGNTSMYLLVTSAIGAVFAGGFAWLGRGHAFKTSKFVQIAIEGVIYALLMRLVGGYVVAHVFAGKVTMSGFAGLIMSMGAGFYEELTYRVILFAVGGKLLAMLLAPQMSAAKRVFWGIFWAIGCAAIFSGVHYVGPLGDVFELRTFVFRWVLGLALTLIYWARGFAAATWAHTLYDAWILVL